MMLVRRGLLMPAYLCALACVCGSRLRGGVQHVLAPSR